MDSVNIIFTFILSALITSFLWAMVVYDEVSRKMEKDWEDYNKQVVTKKIAGHKGVVTKVKKNYAIAKKIIRRGRDERVD